MEFWEIIILFIIFCIVQIIAQIAWQLIKIKLEIIATNKKIDAIYLSIIHKIKEIQNKREEIKK